MARATEMELIMGDEDMARRRDYAVIAAVDDGEHPYILLAPVEASNGGYRLENLVLGRSAPILPDRVNELLRGLELALAQWDRDAPDGEGIFFEFMHAPEQDIRPVSENVVEWTPSVRFTYSNTPDGSAARLSIGTHPERLLVYVVNFTKRQEVEDFRRLIVEAENRMRTLVAR